MIAILNSGIGSADLTNESTIDDTTIEVQRLRSLVISLESLAISRARDSVNHLSNIALTRLESQWRKHPDLFRDSFANHHQGAERLETFWKQLADILENSSERPSMDLILNCIRAEASPVSVQEINPKGRWIMDRFLLLQDSPVSAMSVWFKVSRCLDPDAYQHLSEQLSSETTDAETARQELLQHAREQYREWKDHAEHRRQQFHDYCEFVSASTAITCLVDKTLATSLRESKQQLRQAELLLKSLTANQNDPPESELSFIQSTERLETNTTREQLEKHISDAKAGLISKSEAQMLALEFLQAVHSSHNSHEMNIQEQSSRNTQEQFAEINEDDNLDNTDLLSAISPGVTSFVRDNSSMSVDDTIFSNLSNDDDTYSHLDISVQKVSQSTGQNQRSRNDERLKSPHRTPSKPKRLFQRSIHKP